MAQRCASTSRWTKSSTGTSGTLRVRSRWSDKRRFAWFRISPTWTSLNGFWGSCIGFRCQCRNCPLKYEIWAFNSQGFEFLLAIHQQHRQWYQIQPRGKQRGVAIRYRKRLDHLQNQLEIPIYIGKAFPQNIKKTSKIGWKPEKLLQSAWLRKNHLSVWMRPFGKKDPADIKI